MKFNDYLMIIFADLTDLGKGINDGNGECPHRIPEHSNEDTKMRRVRNNNSDSSFEQGIRQVISEKVAQPTRYADYELDAIQRKEQSMHATSPQKTSGIGFITSGLMQELTRIAHRTAPQGR